MPEEEGDGGTGPRGCCCCCCCGYEWRPESSATWRDAAAPSCRAIATTSTAASWPRCNPPSGDDPCSCCCDGKGCSEEALGLLGEPGYDEKGGCVARDRLRGVKPQVDASAGSCGKGLGLTPLSCFVRGSAAGPSLSVWSMLKMSPSSSAKPCRADSLGRGPPPREDSAPLLHTGSRVPCQESLPGRRLSEVEGTASSVAAVSKRSRWPPADGGSSSSEDSASVRRRSRCCRLPGGTGCGEREEGESGWKSHVVKAYALAPERTHLGGRQRRGSGRRSA